MPLTVFDYGLGENREATQGDIDTMQAFIAAAQRKARPIKPPRIDRVVFDFKLAVYPNPMRNDGMFVAELKNIQPYPGYPDEDRHYPATPETPWKIGCQITPLFAFEIVRRWNLVKERNL